MKESYGEGLATHTDPESCAASRKGWGEALTGAPAGWVSSREITQWKQSGVPTPYGQAEGETNRLVKARARATPRGLRPHARSKTLCAGAGRSRARPVEMVIGSAT
jgi:hypothetical protein